MFFSNIRVMLVVQWVLVIVLAWIVLNMLRYFFFRRGGRGPLFWLSDQWLKSDQGPAKVVEQPKDKEKGK